MKNDKLKISPVGTLALACAFASLARAQEAQPSAAIGLQGVSSQSGEQAGAAFDASSSRSALQPFPAGPSTQALPRPEAAAVRAPAGYYDGAGYYHPDTGPYHSDTSPYYRPAPPPPYYGDPYYHRHEGALIAAAVILTVLLLLLLL